MSKELGGHCDEVNLQILFSQEGGGEGEVVVLKIPTSKSVVASSGTTLLHPETI